MRKACTVLFIHWKKGDVTVEKMRLHSGYPKFKMNQNRTTNKLLTSYRCNLQEALLLMINRQL